MGKTILKVSATVQSKSDSFKSSSWRTNTLAPDLPLAYGIPICCYEEKQNQTLMNLSELWPKLGYKILSTVNTYNSKFFEQHSFKLPPFLCKPVSQQLVIHFLHFCTQFGEKKSLQHTKKQIYCIFFVVITQFHSRLVPYQFSSKRFPNKICSAWKKRPWKNFFWTLF